MTRLIVLTAAAICVSVAAYAASEALTSDEQEVILIKVAPEELAECEATLREVGQMPAVTDSGSPMLIDRTDDLPSVACEA
ncbi:hypothetical protein [Salipiger abyssi]|uniref:hypothetical protein n=1 Tax=Salipiger abyssi TaxID=1250539 RepID=UPI001A8FA2C2|nr:hypothetical protein [Salipiger abyssi]MBN9889234.1 hypothetical protein [Salipiger abyssi]